MPQKQLKNSAKSVIKENEKRKNLPQKPKDPLKDIARKVRPVRNFHISSFDYPLFCFPLG